MTPVKAKAAGFGRLQSCPGRDRLSHRGGSSSESRGASPARFQTEASLLLAMSGAARIIPLALFQLAAIYIRATSALLNPGPLRGRRQLLDAGIGLFQT